MASSSFFSDVLQSVTERGRALLDQSLGTQPLPERIRELSRALVSNVGEASGVARADEILSMYGKLGADERHAFLKFLAEEFNPPEEEVVAAAQRYLAERNPGSLAELARVVDPPRQEFFRRLNLAPHATAELVEMRRQVLELMEVDPHLAPVDADLLHLFGSWFNRGFLRMQRIDWNTPANVLEKIIEYEAVHKINGWSDLRRRLQPGNRKCFAFFHPSLEDDPLIFVEVALTQDIPSNIDVLLEGEDAPAEQSPRTAVFYSISNCQKGLRGISFGNFLIKQVVQDLVSEFPSLNTFVTLSPVPGFANWLAELREEQESPVFNPETMALLNDLDTDDWFDDPARMAVLEKAMMPLLAHYLLREKTADGLPRNAVARFHLGNGALLERLNWAGDLSENGRRQAHGVMVNYLYDLKNIEKNHEALVNLTDTPASRRVRAMLPPEKITPKTEHPEPVSDS